MMKEIYRNPKWLKAAKDQCCVNCGAMDGTVVACHYTGPRQHSYGKGTGIKVHDFCSADLCRECHEAFDRYDYQKLGCTTGDKWELSEMFQHCVLKTIERRIMWQEMTL